MNRILLRLLTAVACLGLVLTFWTPAAPVAAQTGSLSEADVRSAVETWVRSVPVEALPAATVATMEPYIVEGARPSLTSRIWPAAASV